MTSDDLGWPLLASDGLCVRLMAPDGAQPPHGA